MSVFFKQYSLIEEAVKYLLLTDHAAAAAAADDDDDDDIDADVAMMKRAVPGCLLLRSFLCSSVCAYLITP